ncbi:MAG: diaminopropionate ammonia-lyase [Castellaniella sp.]
MKEFTLAGGARLFPNPHALPLSTLYPEALKPILSLEAHAQAWAGITAWPGYAATPLHRLDGLAKTLGLARIDCKDESRRFGLGSFKALGGAWAVAQLLQRESHRPAHEITVACATDGNHGRSVAWGAQQMGCRCVITIHENVSAAREAAIAQYGARVVRVPGNYDDAVRHAAGQAAREGHTIISDTSWPGYMDVPRDVMQGYTIMVQEALDQLDNDALPTHVFIQAGVGGLAAAICAHLWERCGAQRPRIIVAEPLQAACLYESARAGRPQVVKGSLDTAMAGLACGEVSLLAWEVLRPGAQAFMQVPDAEALACMRLLAEPAGTDVPVVAGESAVAGLAACRLALADPAAREVLALDADSRLLVFSSEGDTDPGLYETIVGRSAEAVRKSVRGSCPE